MSWLRQMPDRMAGEQYHIIRQPLTFSTSKVEETVRPGTIREGTFTVYGTSGIRVAGFVSSSDLLMEVGAAEFSGSSDEVAWSFDARHLTAGDEVQGEFRIVSNQGEYRLPFVMHVEAEPLTTPQGTIATLQHFVNLAKTDWGQAVKVFYDARFGALLCEEGLRGGTEHGGQSGTLHEVSAGSESPDADVNAAGAAEKDAMEPWYLWRGLSAGTEREANVEEFLVAAGRKAAIEYIPELTAINTVLLPEDGEERMPLYFFRLTRSGWGYTLLQVTAEGDFLVPETRTIGSADFDASQSAAVRYAIDTERLHAGRNFGALHLRGRWCDLTIPVEVAVRSGAPQDNAFLDETLVPRKDGAAEPAYADVNMLHHREVSQITLSLMRCYVDFRAKKLRGRDWLAKTSSLVDRLVQLEPDDPAAALYKVHVLISSGQQKDAAWALMDFDRRVEEALNIPSYSDPEHRGLKQEDPELYAYRVYLGVLCAEDESRLTAYDAAERVSQELRRAPGDWRIAWILLYLSEELRRRPSQKWALLRDQFDRGCTSPMIYLEAFDMVRANPAILSEPDEFALQVLTFASRMDMIDVEVMSQVNALAARAKHYSERLYRILARAYDRDILKEETLRNIVALLLRGNRTAPESFVWYARGVEAELTLTRLFEYYILSMPEDYTGEIPQVVLRYFCYQCTLPYRKTAQVYSYIMHHRQQYPEIYRQALPAIRAFAMEELSHEHVTRELCYLYWHMLNNDVLTPENAPCAVRVMFSCLVRAEADLCGTGALQLVVAYDQCSGEQKVMMQDGETVLPLYGSRVHLFFEDAAGNRWAAQQHGTVERLARYQDKISMLSAFDTGITGFDRFLAGGQGGSFRITSFNCERFRALAEAPDLRGDFRHQIRMALLRYYDESDTVRELSTFLNDITLEGLTAKERAEILAFMVIHGQCGKAIRWVLTCGATGIDPGILMRLDSALLGEDGMTLPDAGLTPADEAKFVEIVHETYAAGKYDEKMLRCLLAGYEGLSVELDDLRTAAQRFGTDATPVLPRMAAQLLYSGAILEDEEEFLQNYREAGAEDAPVTALMAQMAHYYFVDQVPIQKKTLQRIGEFGIQGRPLFDVCRMAYLRDLSGRSGEFRTEELETAKLFLADLTAEGIFFPFYRRFAGLLPQLQDLADETLIQFKGRPGADVVLHFSVDREDHSGTEVMQEQAMKEMYEGIYVSGFILFFGEQVRYFITDDAERRNVVESGTFGQDTRIADTGSDRFSMINRISTLIAMDRMDEAIQAMEEYDRKADLVARLFGTNGAEK